MTPPLPQAPKMGPVEFDPFAEGELSLTIPLTEPQKEIWTSAQMGREANCSYNESVSLVLKGPLKEEALREAFRQAAGRHEALRMTFSPEGDWVCVVPRLDLEVPLVDLAGLNPEERDRDLAGLLAKEVETPFDLVRGPLLRARIVRLESELHQVLITAHHIVCDGWSIDVLVADLARIYSVLAKGEEPDLEPADLFSDYVSTLALPDRVRAVHEDRNYWLSQYAVQPPVTDLPTDRPRPPLRTYQAGRLDWEVPGELVKSLKNLGTKTGCTFLNVLMAGFAAFIHRLSGQDDIVIGLPAAGQSIEGRETLVGHCVHLLPLRFRLDKDITFREYLAKVRSIVLDSHEHQRVTLGDLIPRMKLARDPSRIPLAPVSFNLDQGIDLAGMSFIGLESEFFSNHRKYDNFEFQINVSPFPDRIVFECMYNSGLWDRETVSQRLEELGVLFRALTEDPDQKVVQAPLLSNREKESILALGTGERIDPLPGRTVVELIEEQAASTPESQAVFHQGGGLTYAQLNRKANALAGFLQQRGVGPGTLVGLCLKRSPAMIVGLAGILKAGGAYLPLDPDNPAQRLARILENSGLKLILTDEATGGRIAPKVGPGVGLESGWAGLDDEQAENPVRRAGLDDPAYVIYTSGSTGVPKGAVIAHRSLAAYVQSLDAVYGVGSGDRLLQFSTLWFDASVHDIFITLCRGACLVLRDEETLGSARLFFQFCRENRVSLFILPTAYFNLLGADMEGAKIPTGLRLVSCGGEAISPEAAAAWRSKLHPDSRLINLYGPTEATVSCAYYEIEPGTGNGPVPIGRPQPNNRLYILDRHGNLCPVGVSGELHIGGPQVAVGYLHDPKLSEGSFIPDPFDPVGKGRLYKSGDICRFNRDGLLEFMGRTDHQVKIRGFRIELGEIKSALAAHPQVREAHVMVRPDGPGGKSLVAHAVPVAGGKIDPQGLRRFLEDRLPGYMIPDEIIPLAEMPLTTGGKIDQKALPSFGGPALPKTKSQPASPTERLLTGLFAEILKLDKVEPEDDFFELGGHSLLAVKLVSRLEKEIGRSLPVTALFETPTSRGLAKVLDLALGLNGSSTMVKIKSGRARRPFFHIGQMDRHVRNAAKHLQIRNPIYLIHVQPMEPGTPHFTEVEAIAEHCLEEIRKIQPQGPYLLGGYCLGGMVAYELAQRLRAEGQEIEYLGLIETYLPGSLQRNRGMGPWAMLKSAVGYSLRERPGRGLVRDAAWMLKKIFLKCGSAFWYRICGLAQGYYGKKNRAVPRLFRNEMVALNLAQSSYRPKPYPGPVYIFKAAITAPWLKIEPTLGWSEFVQGEVRVREVPGDHTSMYEDPQVTEFARLVGQSVEEEG